MSMSRKTGRPTIGFLSSLRIVLKFEEIVHQGFHPSRPPHQSSAAGAFGSCSVTFSYVIDAFLSTSRSVPTAEPISVEGVG